MSIIGGEVVSKVSCGNKKLELQERINKSSTIPPEEKKLLLEELNGNQDQFTKAEAELGKRSDVRSEKVCSMDKSATYRGGILAAIAWGSPILTGLLKDSSRAGWLTAAITIPLGMIVAIAADKLAYKAILKLEYVNRDIRHLENDIKNLRVSSE